MTNDSQRIDGYEGVSIELAGDQIIVRLLKRGLLYFPQEKTFPISNVTSVETSPPTKNFGGFIKINTPDTYRRNYFAGVVAGAKDRYDQNIVQFATDEEFSKAEMLKSLIFLKQNNPR